MVKKTKVTFTGRRGENVNKVSFYVREKTSVDRWYKFFKKIHDGEFYIPTESELNRAIADTPQYLRTWFMFYEGR